jgi:hypothetical protein
MSAMTRRHLLITTALAGAAAAAGLWPGRAVALRVEEDEVKERLYFAACEERAAHDQLVRELIAQLEGQEGHDKAVETVRARTCPICGCRLGDTGALPNPS